MRFGKQFELRQILVVVAIVFAHLIPPLPPVRQSRHRQMLRHWIRRFYLPLQFLDSLALLRLILSKFLAFLLPVRPRQFFLAAL